jgi:hypothetical protein
MNPPGISVSLKSLVEELLAATSDANDTDGDDVTTTITAITSDEPPSSPTGKKHARDTFGVGTDTAALRAERLSKGNGRVYEIGFIADDGRGDQTSGSVKVKVPHSNRKSGHPCIDDGQNYDGTDTGPNILPKIRDIIK